MVLFLGEPFPLGWIEKWGNIRMKDIMVEVLQKQIGQILIPIFHLYFDA